MRDIACDLLFGHQWRQREDIASERGKVIQLFDSAHVRHRRFVVNPATYHAPPKSTGDRMIEYMRAGYPLAREALERCLSGSPDGAASITDLFLVSCTGYAAPGLDIMLTRDLHLSPDTRRLLIGHMGCFGAMAGLRTALPVVRASPGAAVALVAIELCSLHFINSLDTGLLTSYALFGDAAAAITIASSSADSGPELIDTYCVADFGAAQQMTWHIGDLGFEMGLSQRVPVTLRRSVGAAMERLLAPHGLSVRDISHWLVHPGGPSILEAVERALALSREQMAQSWDTLRDHGNCSSATVLLMLDALLRDDRARRGEWGVMMAFGPGLTLETMLLRF
jgi:alkylresorcinol/alkylpyrone synthase